MQIFAHRGYVIDKSPENSIAALHNAYKSNFNGVEIDLWFIDDKFYIVHDQPEVIDLANLALLQDFLIYEDFGYWLDFKNLDFSNYKKAINCLRSNIKNHNLASSFFVPYIDDYNLCEIIFKEVNKVFENNLKIAAIFDNINKIEDLRKLISNINLKYLSIKSDLVTQQNIEKLSDINLMAWTIKDQETFIRLKQQNIKIFASDILLD